MGRCAAVGGGCVGYVAAVGIGARGGVDSGRGDGDTIFFSASHWGNDCGAVGMVFDVRVLLTCHSVVVVEERAGKRVEWRGSVFVDHKGVEIEGRCCVGEDGFEVFDLGGGEVDGEVRVVGRNEGEVDFESEGELVVAEGSGFEERRGIVLWLLGEVEER